MPAIRCPNCAKFASLETTDPPEIQSESVDEGEEGAYQITGEVRIVRECDGCGEELKEALLEFTIECPRGFNEEVWEYEVEATSHERTQTKGKKGRPIRNRRYMKTFYGAEITTTFTPPPATDEGEEVKAGDIEVSVTVEEQASYFEELV